MELRLSNLAKTYPASGIRKMFDLAAGYDDVIALTLGEPNFETPAYIKEAAKKALDENYTHYAPNAGLPVLREAIAKRYQKSHWAGYKAENVIVTVGALEGLTLGMLALLNPGDEILVPDPGFANYYGQAKIVGAVPVPVPAHEENGFNMTAADIEKCITPKTKAIIVNSPCNPTGAVMSEADVRAIAEVVKKHNLWVFSDEPYDAIVYDGVKAFSMAEIDEVRDHVVILNSFSKTYAMTGWRVGFLLMSDPNYIKEMAKLNEVVRVQLLAGRRRRGAQQQRVREEHGGRLHPPPRHSGRRHQRGARLHLRQAEGQLLCLREHQSLRQELSGVRRGADPRRARHLRARHGLRRDGRGVSASGVCQLRREPQGGRPPHRRVRPQGVPRHEVRRRQYACTVRLITLGVGTQGVSAPNEPRVLKQMPPLLRGRKKREFIESHSYHFFCSGQGLLRGPASGTTIM